MVTGTPETAIFLDVDGFVCTQRVHAAFRDKGPWRRPDPVAIAFLNRLCDDFGAIVVVSSSWRKTNTRDDILAMLRQGGFTGEFHVDWATPVSDRGFRGDEVAAWIDAHPEVKRWIAIDDNHDFHPGQQVVHTDTENGMLYEHYKRACALLGSDDPWDVIFAGQLREAEDLLAECVREMAEAVRNGSLDEALRMAEVVERLLARR